MESEERNRCKASTSVPRTAVRAVFLDRDGVINEDRFDYVKGVEELRIYSYTAEAVRVLNDAGYAVFVVSNQQGVAKGIISEDSLAAMQAEITRQVTDGGGRISGFYYCRHLATDGCDCRKPEPGLLLRAAGEHGIDLAASYMVGDTERDLIAGERAGCTTVLVQTGIHPEQAASARSRAHFVAQDLLEAARRIVETSK